MKRQDAIGRIYFVFSSLLMIWGVGISILFNPQVSYEMALNSARLANIAVMYGLLLWFHFVLIYINMLHAFRLWLYVMYGLITVIALMGFTKWFIPSVYGVMDFKYYGQPGPLFHLYAAFFCVIIPYSAFLLWKHAQRSSGINKMQGLGLFWASSIGYISVAPIFLPIYGVAAPQYSLLLLPIYPFVMAYSMIRHRLFDDEALAQAAHRDKLAVIGTLSTSINHEIRNPLYIIHGMAESFLYNFRGEERNLAAVKSESVAVLEKTAQQAKRAMEIMSQLSMFAKQQVSDETTETETASLQECLDNVLPLVRHEMVLDKISFESRLPHDLPLIKANPRQIEEVLFNLIVNACQALKAEGGSIKITALSDGEKVTLIHEDSGPGIPEPQLKKIFEPFYTTKNEGTGLGLYIVKQLVEKNGGRIKVESELRRGTRFLLEFPL